MRRLLLGLAAVALVALAAHQTFAQLSLPAGIAQLVPFVSAPSGCTAPFIINFAGTAPFTVNAGTAPFKTGC